MSAEQSLDLDIHPSMLGSAADCELRAVIDRAGISPAWRELFSKAGYQIDRRILTSAGAAVGTGFHKAAEHLLTARLNDTEPKMKEAVEAGVESFTASVVDGMEPDDVTPDRDAATKQINILTSTWFGFEGYKVRPVEVEQRYEAPIKPGYKYVGTLDWRDTQRLDDNKSGKRRSTYDIQIGTYSLIQRVQKWTAKSLTHTWTKRMPLSKAPAIPVTVAYDREIAEHASVNATKRLIRNTEAFVVSGDTGSFAANPMSIMCTPKYCTAYGTQLCTLWRAKEQIK